MPIIKIIRASIRDIQKLPHQALKKVNNILSQLSQGDERNTKPLKGYSDKLLRTKEDELRLIWERGDSDDIFIIKAGLRKDVYQGEFNKRHRFPAYIWQQPELKTTSFKKILVNDLNPQVDSSWYRFIYGEFRYSPVITDRQQEISQFLLDSVANPTADIRSRTLLVQSAPGTGKTVCAALISCEFHRQQEWNTMLIVPETLCKDIAEYRDVKETIQKNQKGFFLGTYRDWIKEISPQLYRRFAHPEEELQALRKGIKQRQEINYHDVLLYQAFILNETKQNPEKSPIYQAHKERIDKLREKIKHELWKAELKQRLCRLDAAHELILSPPSPPQDRERTIVIIDEAQNYLLAELKAIINLCKIWYEQNHITYLWLLGDLNQRTQPVDFHWGHLELKKTIELHYNYRNSRYILEFANQFLLIAKKENSLKGGSYKQIPEPANPEYAYEEGEPLVLLEYALKEEALEFLKLLAQASKTENHDGRSLLQELANEVKILYGNSPIDKYNKNFAGLEFLNAEQAQGREFESGIAFCIFEGDKPPCLDESFRWYTLLTRIRSRLLIVATKQELDRIGRDYFTKCDRLKSETAAIKWITELASESDLTKNQHIVQQRLLASCENKPLHLYWDTYTALEFAKVEAENLYQWEQEAINLLKQHSVEDRNFELSQTTSISLRCLLLRSMDHSWRAVKEALRIQNTDINEYKRLLESIARDLEAKNLPYEAARVRTKLGIPFPSDYPFPEIAQKSGSLVSLLYKSILANPF